MFFCILAYHSLLIYSLSIHPLRPHIFFDFVPHHIHKKQFLSASSNNLTSFKRKNCMISCKHCSQMTVGFQRLFHKNATFFHAYGASSGTSRSIISCMSLCKHSSASFVVIAVVVCAVITKAMPFFTSEFSTIFLLVL